MALAAGRQSWTNNGAYGSHVKSLMHFKDDAYDSEGPVAWYRSENGVYGAFQNPHATSFKDLASYRNNVKKTWEFKVSPTTYRELGSFYSKGSNNGGPTKLVPLQDFNPNVHSIDVAVQSDSADIHFMQEGKISRSAQISEEEIVRQMIARDESDGGLSRRKPLPPIKHTEEKGIATNDDFRDSYGENPSQYRSGDAPKSPINLILRKIEDREREDGAWHRYIEEKPRLIEELKHKYVPGTRAHSPPPPFVPSVHLPEAHNNRVTNLGRRQALDDSPTKSHFYKSQNDAQPAMERHFISDEYGGESKWTNQLDYSSTKKRQDVPLYLETPPWPMSTTMPIQTAMQPPSVGILPTGLPRAELKQHGDPRRGIRVLNDHVGNRAMFVL